MNLIAALCTLILSTLLAACSGSSSGGKGSAQSTDAAKAVISSNLENNAVDIPLDILITLEFSRRPALGANLKNHIVLVRKADATPVAFSMIAKSGDSYTLLITPDKLEHATSYQLIVAATLPFADGVSLEQDVVLEFTTLGNYFGCRPSGPVLLRPAANNNQVPPGRPLRIILNRDLMPASLPGRATAVKLRDNRAQTIPVTLSLDHDRCLITITPEEKLEYHTAYQLDVDLAALTGLAAENFDNQLLTRNFTTMDNRFLGTSFFDRKNPEITNLTAMDLLGVLRFGGRWVTATALVDNNPANVIPDTYLQTLHEFCEFAVNREQRSIVQLPVFLPSTGIQQALRYLQQRQDHCNLLALSIGNEPDRYDNDEEHYAEHYDWADYLADLQRIVPLVRQQFPEMPLIALDLSAFEEYNQFRALREWVDPFCSSSDPAIGEIDFLSIHFYPFTGAQKSWDMLKMGRLFASNLAQLPDRCPDLLIGEFNTTYQWRSGATYPGSGGDAFMSLLTLPEILHQEKVLGLLHWSLLEDSSSTLGLFQTNGLIPRPIYPGYLLLNAIRNTHPLAASPQTGNIEANAFIQDNDTLHLYLGNYQPVFQRNLSISNQPQADIRITVPGLPFAGTLKALPPMSLTHLVMDAQSGIIRQQLISYQHQDISLTAYDTSTRKAHCVALADFSEPNIEGPDFVGKDFNQNRKIASGGTPLPAAEKPYSWSVSIAEHENYLVVKCLPTLGRQYCGVSLPVIADTDAPEARFRDWSTGTATAWLQLTISTPLGVDQKLLAAFADSYLLEPDNVTRTHRHPFLLHTGGNKVVKLPWKQFSPAGSAGAPDTGALQQLLSQLATINILLEQPDSGSEFHLHKLEICDAWN